MSEHETCARGPCVNEIKHARFTAPDDFGGLSFCSVDCILIARRARAARTQPAPYSTNDPVRSPQTDAEWRALIDRHRPAGVTVDNVVLGLIDVEMLARRLWEADPVVQQLVAEKADDFARLPEPPPELQYEGRPVPASVTKTGLRITFGLHDSGRRLRAFDVAWRIDDGGHRSRWVEHVRRALRRQ